MKTLTLQLATATALAALALAGPRLAAATLYSTTVLQDEPLVYWSFDEDDIYENAIQRAPLTAPPVTTENDLAPGLGAGRVSHAAIGSGLTKLGNAADFSGGNYFSVPALRSGKTTLDGAWAVEFWVQAQGLNIGDRQEYLLHFGNNSPAFIYGYKLNELEIFAGVRTDGGPTFNDEAWHHVLWVFYGDESVGIADRVDAWFDGVQYAYIRNDFSRALNVGAQFFVGAAEPSGVGGFEGRIDELAIYDLSGLPDEAGVSAKVEQMVGNHIAAAESDTGPSYASVVLASEPFLYWNFDEEEGNALQLAPITLPEPDNSMNELAPYGNAYRVRHQDVGSGLQLGDAIELDGLNSFFGRIGGLDIGRSPVMSGPWAIEMWYQLREDQEMRYFMNMGTSAGRNLPAVIYGYFGKRIEVFGGGNRSGTAGVELNDRNWHHLLVVNYNNLPAGSGEEVNRVDLYLDNELHANVGNGFNTVMDFRDWLLFGAAVPVAADPGASGSLIGRMDELAIYDLSAYRTAEEVTAKVEAMAASHFAAAFGSTLVGTITITQDPADAEREVGGTVTFNVAATVTGTTEPLTYQWQRNGVNIIGATNPSYTIPSLTLYDVGAHTYRARASAGPLFKYSNPATLTVAVPPPGLTTPYSIAVKQDQPALYWSFDEMGGPAVQHMPVSLTPVTTENDLVPAGAGRVSHAEIGSGLNRLGRAADFDGSTFFIVDALRSGKASLTGAWAVEFWLQAQGPNTDNRQDYLLSFFAPGYVSNSPAFIYDYKPDELEIFAGVRTDGGPTFNDEAWHHVVWVFYGDGTVGVANRVDAWFDGTQFTNIRNTFTRALSVNGRLIVGAALPDGIGGFEGRMDEVAVYDLSGLPDEAAVSAKVEQMVSNHRAAAQSDTGPSYASVVLASEPFLYWNFDEANGNARQLAPINLTPLNEANNNLVLSTGAGRVQHSAIGSGRYLGNAADFDGVSYHLAEQLDTGLSQLPAPWAVEFWMQVQGPTAPDALRRHYLLNLGADSPAFRYDSTAWRDELDIFAGGNEVAGPVIRDQNWHHVMWVFYGTGTEGVADRVDVYLNGVAASYPRGAFNRALNVGGRLVLGASQPGYNGFRGRIDELALYDLSGLTDEAAVTARVEDMVARHIQASTQVPVQPPTLTFNIADGQLTLTWTGTGYMLQERQGLQTGASWSNVPGGNTSPVNIPVPADGTRFYRLSTL